MSGPLALRRHGPRFAGLRGRAHVLPSFFVVGVQKGGTTSLYADLAQHPNVLGVPGKEIFYFDKHYGESEAWYRCWFPSARQMAQNSAQTRLPTITGEASASYLDHPSVPDRAAALTPDARIIALLRDPVERAISHYFHNRRKKREPLALLEALEAEPERLAGEAERAEADPTYYSEPLMHFGYAHRGHYADHLERWFGCFPRDRVLVLQSEAYFDTPEAVFRQAADFLGLSAWAPEAYPVRNPGSNRREVAPEVRAWLQDHFAPHNARLEALLGRPFGWSSGG